MKRALLLIGPLLALGGAIGLLSHGSAIVDVTGVLLFNTGAIAASLGEMQQSIQMMIVMVYLLTVGLVVAIGAMTFPGQPQCVTIIGKLLGCAAGGTLIGGAVLSGQAIDDVRRNLVALSTSEKAPKPGMLQQIIDAGGEELHLGIMVYIAASVVLLLVGVVGFRRSESTRMGSTVKIAMMLMVIAAVAIAIAGASALVWYNVDKTLFLVTDFENPAEPAELAGHLLQAYQAGVVLFSGMGGLGVVAVLGYLFSPNYRRPKPPVGASQVAEPQNKETQESESADESA